MILRHNCEHKGQDELHGKNMRVANWATKKNAYRCTVCGGLITATNQEIIDKKKKETK